MNHQESESAKRLRETMEELHNARVAQVLVLGIVFSAIIVAGIIVLAVYHT